MAHTTVHSATHRRAHLAANSLSGFVDFLKVLFSRLSGRDPEEGPDGYPEEPDPVTDQRDARHVLWWLHRQHGEVL